MGLICRYLADKLAVICLFLTFLVLEPTSQLSTQPPHLFFSHFLEEIFDFIYIFCNIFSMDGRRYQFKTFMYCIEI